VCLILLIEMFFLGLPCFASELKRKKSMMNAAFGFAVKAIALSPSAARSCQCDRHYNPHALTKERILYLRNEFPISRVYGLRFRV
jgi:hypothetical protein